MRRIKKTFTKTTISASSIIVKDGKVEVVPLPPVETFETVTPNNAVKLFRKLSDVEGVAKMTVTVTSTTEKSVTYAMDGVKFIEYGYIVDEN